MQTSSSASVYNVELFKNLTPHAINVYSADGATLLITFPPSGTVARCATKRVQIPAGNIPVFKTEYGQVTDLPPVAEVGHGYIVSALVRNALPDRKDLFSPGELLRSPDGNPIGCKGLDCN